MRLKRGGLLEEGGAGGVRCAEGQGARGSVREGVEPPAQRVGVVEVGVRRHGGDQSGLRGKRSHSCFQELREHDIVRIPTVPVHQSLSRNVLDNVLLVVIPHGT